MDFEGTMLRTETAASSITAISDAVKEIVEINGWSGRAQSESPFQYFGEQRGHISQEDNQLRPNDCGEDAAAQRAHDISSRTACPLKPGAGQERLRNFQKTGGFERLSGK